MEGFSGGAIYGAEISLYRKYVCFASTPLPPFKNVGMNFSRLLKFISSHFRLRPLLSFSISFSPTLLAALPFQFRSARFSLSRLWPGRCVLLVCIIGRVGELYLDACDTTLFSIIQAREGNRRWSKN